jgi:hypothetical protein
MDRGPGEKTEATFVRSRRHEVGPEPLPKDGRVIACCGPGLSKEIPGRDIVKKVWLGIFDISIDESLLYEALRCPEKLKIFTKEDGGNQHYRQDNLGIMKEEAFSWVISTLLSKLS